MKDQQQPTSLQASFWITKQEQIYILVIAALFFLGIVARYFYLKIEHSKIYTPAATEERESAHE